MEGIVHCVSVICNYMSDDVLPLSYVAEKPRIVESPKDIIAKENTDVIFHCRATGDPQPTVIWKKFAGQIAAER